MLSPYYAVLNVTSSTLISEPWQASTSLLVIPGGADLPYCRELNGAGNKQIDKYVRQGGRYLGLCAGGYYASARVEFEVGNREMEVSGSRELKFFPGIARGSVFSGFQYGNHLNAKAAHVSITDNLLTQSFQNPTTTIDREKLQEVFTYVDGGCLFVDAETYKSKGVQVLARYLDKVEVSGSDLEEENIDKTNPAAAVYCKVGKGSAILTGLHPEFSPDLLKKIPSEKNYTAMIEVLEKHNSSRIEFMKAILLKMGLKVNSTEVPMPGLSRLFLTSLYPPALKHFINKLREEIGFSGPQNNLLVCNNDTFRIWNASQPDRFITAEKPSEEEEGDLNKIIKDIDVYTDGLPDNRVAAHFNLSAYYAKLKELKTAAYPMFTSENEHQFTMGATTLYGEVVTSTSTMLFQNYKFLKCLPTGFTAIATVQVAGRGRSNNVWVNPVGVLPFSTVVRLPMTNEAGQPTSIVFVQYLAAIAIVNAIKNYARSMLGIEDFPVFIKWPNDVYIVNPFSEKTNSFRVPDFSETEYQDLFFKVSGILVNTTVLDGEYVIVIGIGINVSNAAPSKSLNRLVDEINDRIRVPQGKPPYGHFEEEPLLAYFMHIWEDMIRNFQFQGFRAFEQEYYDKWLHTDKIVTLEQYGNTKAVIKGVSSDFGMLIAEEVDRDNKPTGKLFELQPDGNSFDMMKGLLKKKQ